MRIIRKREIRKESRKTMKRKDGNDKLSRVKQKITKSINVLIP